MVRNAILLISSVAVLVLLYLAYQTVMQPGVADEDEAENLRRDLPVTRNDPSASSFGVVTPEMRAGVQGTEKFEWTNYDPRTGRPTAAMRGETWRKLPNTTDRVEVTSPELTLVRPDGLTALITATRGELKLRDLRRQKFEPQSGRLEGAVRIHVQRETDDEARTGSPFEDGMTIETDQLYFDLETRELKTDQRIRAVGESFSILGVGLNVVWNQIDNRVDLLSIDRGEHMVLWLKNGLNDGLRDATGGAKPAKTASAAQTTQPQKQKPARRPTTYLVRLEGGVLLDHFRDGHRIGGIEGDEIELLFDEGSRGAHAVAPTSADAATPPEPVVASRPARDPDAIPSIECVQITWFGRMALGPIPDARPSPRPRRHITALGNPLVLDLGDRRLNAGRFEFHDETQRLWLAPIRGERIEIAVGPQLTASSESIFVDRRANLVKLTGGTTLLAHDTQQSAPMRIRCNLWAELRLATCDEPSGPDSAVSDPLAMLGGTGREGKEMIDSAVLVGDTRIDVEGQSLRADRVESTFLPQIGTQPLSALLDRTVASGAVRLTSGDDNVWPDWIDYLAAKLRNPLRPAAGAWRRATQRLDSEWLELRFARGANDRPYAATAKAIGAVRMKDRDRSISARGRTLTADLGEGNELRRAVVYGSGGQPARIQADSFDVRGDHIVIDPLAETLEVPGRSRLEFTSSRSLRGEQRRRAAPVAVTSRDRLFVNNRANTVDLSGEVEARSGDESLQAVSMTLYMEDVSHATEVAPSPLANALAQARKALTGEMRKRLPARQVANSVQAAPGATAPSSARRGRGSVRKEPQRLVAQNAIVISESFASPGDAQPAVHQSIQAPEMEFDVRQRMVHTTGLTILGVIDRRLATDEKSLSDSGGLPSALVARGPSLTHIRCKQSMVYQLGPDGPGRRDPFVFDGDVAMRYFAGPELLSLPNASAIFPQFAAHPDLLDKYKSRYTELDSDRLSGLFEPAREKAAVRTDLRGQPALRLASLNAEGNVRMRDERRPLIREVEATQIVFDRVESEIGVYGSKGSGRPALIRSKNVDAQRLDMPYEGFELTIDLTNNTVRTGPMRASSIRN
jgi:lipopolysaccharide export system protein LptC